MGFVSRLWKIVTMGSTLYLVYHQVQQVNQAKNQFFADLPPELQAEWIQYFGKPGAPADIQNPIIPAIQAAGKVVTQLDTVKAGV